MSNKMKDKIEKLLAKAEGTSNDHERDAFTAKAQRLMLEWGIEEAELESRGEIKPEPVVEESRTWRTSYAIAWVKFAFSVADGLGGLRVLKSGTGDRQTAFVIGHKTDVDNFWILMNSLEHQADRARKIWWKTAQERKWGLTTWEEYKIQREFLLAFGQTCGLRLRALRREVHVDATPGAALVLVSKDKRVQNHIEQAYPSLRTSNSIARGESGYVAGHQAGERARLGNASVDTGSSTPIGS